MIKFNFEKFGKQNATKRKHSNYGEIRKNNNVAYGTFSVYGNNGAIYGIKCKHNNKVYVGATKHLQRRLMKHFNELHHNRHRTKELQKDFNKYGISGFDIIIYENTKEALLDKEKAIQIAFGIENLYNEKISGYYVHPDYSSKLASSHKNTHKTKEYRDKMSKLKTNKIGQYDMYMNLIKIWDSAIIICEEFNYTRSVILSACNGSKKQAYGYKWRYVDDKGNIINNGYLKAKKIQNNN